jgi:hypothetical protein
MTANEMMRLEIKELQDSRDELRRRIEDLERDVEVRPSQIVEIVARAKSESAELKGKDWRFKGPAWSIVLGLFFVLLIVAIWRAEQLGKLLERKGLLQLPHVDDLVSDARRWQ